VGPILLVVSLRESRILILRIVRKATVMTMRPMGGAAADLVTG